MGLRSDSARRRNVLYNAYLDSCPSAIPAINPRLLLTFGFCLLTFDLTPHLLPLSSRLWARPRPTASNVWLTASTRTARSFCLPTTKKNNSAPSSSTTSSPRSAGTWTSPLTQFRTEIGECPSFSRQQQDEPTHERKSTGATGLAKSRVRRPSTRRLDLTA